VLARTDLPLKTANQQSALDNLLDGLAIVDAIIE